MKRRSFIQWTGAGAAGLSDRIRFTPTPFLPGADFCFGLRRSLGDIDKILPRVEAAAQAARKSGALRAVLAKYR
jgi:hypothetical protein